MAFLALHLTRWSRHVQWRSGRQPRSSLIAASQKHHFPTGYQSEYSNVLPEGKFVHMLVFEAPRNPVKMHNFRLRPMTKTHKFPYRRDNWTHQITQSLFWTESKYSVHWTLYSASRTTVWHLRSLAHYCVKDTINSPHQDTMCRGLAGVSRTVSITIHANMQVDNIYSSVRQSKNVYCFNNS